MIAEAAPNATTLHVIGAGRIGRGLIRAIGATPYRLVGASDRSATLFDRHGLDGVALAGHKSAGGRFAEREGAADLPLPSVLLHGAADVVVDCTATELSRGPDAVARAIAALDAGSRVIFAAKHALATEPLAFLESGRFRRIGFSAVLGGSGLALQRELDELRGAFESVAIVGNTTTTAVITAIENGASTDDALARACHAGFLEADASKDLDGSDAAIKLAIVASFLTRSHVGVAEIERPSFDRLDPGILRARRLRGRTTRLVGRLHAGGGLSLAYEEMPRASALAAPAGHVIYSYGLKQGGARVHIGSGVGTDGTVRALLSDLDAWIARRPGKHETVDTVSLAPGARLFVPDSALPLDHGGRLETARLGFQIEGREDAPVVIVQGGISSDRHVCRTEQDPTPGWWDAVVGPGRAIDTRRYRVLSTDFLGGAGASSGPDASGASFPAVTSHDQAELIVRLLDALGVETAHAFVGASYGGMVGLALAERHPHRLGRLVAFSAPERSHPAATAVRSVQRRIVGLGVDRGFDREAVAVARSIAMISYRGCAELKSRFDAPPDWRGGEPVFPVERYLESRGAAFARTATPPSYVALSRAIDLHRVRGESIRVPTLLIGAATDVLVPLDQLEELAEKLPCGRDVVRLASAYGHDAFLKETDTIGAVIREALDGAAP
jgi:homoserine O-acetyltransferase